MITLVTEPKDYSSKAIAVYKKLGAVHFLPQLVQSQRPKVLKSADILVVRLAHQIDKTWLDAMPNLKIIATNTTGLNHVDVEYADQKGVRVVSLRGETKFLEKITSTAELTFGLLLALVRRIPHSFEDVRRGNWNRDAFKGNQLSGKTFGILGYGRLGRIVARYARAFGMNVIAHDPHVSNAVMRKEGVKSVAMDNLFKESDALSVHVLLTDKTHNLVKPKHFKLMKPTAYLINTSRGEIIERDALYKALKTKWIAGAAIDVMRDERADGKHLKKDPLWNYAKTHDNLLVVPHTGGAAYEAMQITEEFVADLVKKHINKNRL